MAIAGIDVGTSGCKCTIYSIQGVLLSDAYEEYSSCMHGNHHTLDANLVWESVKLVIRRAFEKMNQIEDKIADKIEAIGVTSFGEAAILLDEKGLPLCPSLLYTDARGSKQCKQLQKHFGFVYLTESTGLQPSPMYSIPKLMWIKENEPEIMKRTSYICLFEDFIVYQLSGIRQIDYSMASRTMAFDMNQLTWNTEILNYAGISEKALSKVVPTGTPAGKIKAEIAQELGIDQGAMIVSGCHDQVAAAIGTGSYKKGMAVDGMGTVECITPVFDSQINRKKLYEGSYAIVPFIQNQYVTYAFSLTGGALLKWYRDKIASMEAGVARQIKMNPYDYFDRQVDTSKPSGLLVLPHFSGAATPYMDQESKGAILGVTMETKSIDIYQALMEGVTFEMLLNIEKLEEAGIKIEKIRATGGGAVSPVWLQLKADILNKPIISLGAAQSGTLGCIMLSGLACGIYSTIEEAESIFVKEKQIYYPDSVRHEQYQKLYQKYKKLYSAVKSVLIEESEEVL